MTCTLRSRGATLMTAMLTAALFSLPQACLAAPQSPASSATTSAQAGNPATANATARLDKKQYSNVKVNVDQGIATLTGTVDFYFYKAEAEKTVRKAKGVTAVRNLIKVAGPSIPDQLLQSKLQEKLAYDRVGYGNTFNAITVSVENGVATVGGHARTDVDKDSALILVSTYPGVKDLAGKIEVDPVSLLDDQTRMQVETAVYGYSVLSKYWANPAKPIRISVQNGHVELYGTVDSQGDKEVAFIRANGVPGVFSVKNYLQVAGQPIETQK